MKRLLLASALIVAFAPCGTTAQAGEYFFRNYSEWERSRYAEKMAYLAGAFDTLVSVGVEQQGKAMQHYDKCMIDSRMDLAQFTDAVSAFGRAHPEAQGPIYSVQGTMLQYLIRLCGLPKLQ